MKVEEYCDVFRTWRDLVLERAREDDDVRLADAIRKVDLTVSKSCLLHRMLYCGEGLSQTPCPVHKGRWSGCHFGWPGKFWSDGRPVEESPLCRQWYDAGCRCFQHKCGCTTGWQPDEHCGCRPKEADES